jgi:hypothetical protein
MICVNKKIILKINQLEFLIKNINDEKLISKLHEIYNEGANNNKKHPSDSYLLFFSISEIEEILNELTFLLTLIGVNKEGEINNQGLFVEELIDLFLKN